MASLSHAYCLTKAEKVDEKKRALGGLAPWKEALAKQLIANHAGRWISVVELATACSMSRSHFSRAFKSNTGFSPKEWNHLQRIRQAKELLSESDLSLIHISLECGFCDQSHFCRTFSKLEGINPKAWRSAVRQNQLVPSSIELGRHSNT
ncbi:AraC family transcriptional regulator [Pseudomonas sp. KB-10]|uniref:helix-turn-helix domain-containing protein n=1 Tax=Pseudomonas sp. KB-10 TaxID=2292264 RepID=UPI001BAFAB2E|nr:AraC family transcriptional regulator [Pseudomonas sp. KB-10]